jgi:hypothetical protein
MSKKEIREYVEELEIPYLLHFTHISNLERIMEKGLLSREAVDASNDEIHTNDEGRFDGRTNTVSLSIAHPNDRMFYKYREIDEDWCVVALDEEVLWKLDCLFFKNNAAVSEMSCLKDHEVSTIESFKGMYEEQEHLNSREDQCLKPYDPTDKEAEVLVVGDVPLEYICAVVLSNRQAKKKYKDLLSDVQIAINSPNKGVYASRLYRRKWQ